MNKFSALYEDLWEKSPREIADHFERDTKGDALSNAKKYKAELSKRKNRTDPRRVDAAIYMLAKETDRRPREQSFESRMTGASGESEVTMIKFETKKKSFRDLAKDTSLKVKTKSDLEKIADASLPKDDSKYEYFYHATRNRSDVDQILSKGILPGRGNSRVWLSKDEIRDLGGGIFVVRVPKGKAEAGTDRVETGLKYREWTVSEVPSGDIVRVMREIPRSGTDHTIREDELAKYLLKNTSDRDDPSDLPEEYRKWFDIKI